MTTTTMNSSLTFGKAMKAGLIAGLVSAALNNVWSLIAQALGSEAPAGFPIAVTISSILPTLIGAVLFFVLVKYLGKGELIFVIIAATFTLVSLIPTINTTEMPDGTVVGAGFTMLTLPMHLIAGAVAIWGIPRFSR